MKKRINKLVIIPILLIGIILSVIFITNKNNSQELSNAFKANPNEVQKATEYSIVESIDNHPTLTIGVTKTYTAVIPDGVTPSTVSWSCTNISTATCSGTGTSISIQGIGAGNSKLRGKIGDTQVAEFDVTVVAGSINVGNISADDHLTITVGQTYQLQATTNPSGRTISYSSKQPAIATVSDSGLVTGNVVGNTHIILRAEGCGDKSITVTVKAAVAVTSVTLNKTSVKLLVNGTETLTATVKPDDATNKTITWSSSDESVATVNSSGKITAKKLGTADITATANNGKTATATVVVYKPMTSITLSKISETLKVGDTDTLTYSYLPTDATDTEVTWSSSDETIATVDQTGKVTAVKVGEATITATAKTGSAKASCKYTVTEAGNIVYITKLTISSSTKKVKVGKTLQLKVTIEPSNATEGVIWSSSDESIATVDQNGKVTGVKAGKVTITVSNQDGSIKDSIQITVVANSSGGGNPGTGASISIVSILALLGISKFLIDYSKKYEKTHKMIHKV